MLKFKTSCAVLAYLSFNLLNEVGLSLFRYFEVGLRVCDIVVKKFTSAISSPDEFLYNSLYYRTSRDIHLQFCTQSPESRLCSAKMQQLCRENNEQNHSELVGGQIESIKSAAVTTVPTSPVHPSRAVAVCP